MEYDIGLHNIDTHNLFYLRKYNY